MKIAFITPDYPPIREGGAATSCQILVNELRKKGIHVDVYAFVHFIQHVSIKETKDKNGKDVYIPITKSLIKSSIQMLGRIKQILNSGYNLIHVYNVNPIPSVQLMRCLTNLKTPVVATLNNPLLACLNFERCLKIECKKCHLFKSLSCARYRTNGNLLQNIFFKYPLFQIAQIFSVHLTHYIALTRAVKERYAIAGVPSERITVVPNIMDQGFTAIDLDKEQCRQKVGVSLDKTVILFAGTFRAFKGAIDLIEALNKMDKKILAAVHVVMLGRGEEEGKIRKLVNRYKLTCHVTIRSVDYNELPFYYKASDIFVHPVRGEEAFSRTWLEAMQFGIPILSSKNPSAKEVLKNCAIFF